MTTNDWHTHAVQSAAAGAGPATPDLGFDDRSLGRGFTPDPDPDALTGDLAALTRVLLGVADVVDKEEPAPAADLVDVTALGAADEPEADEAPTAQTRMAPSRVINDLAFLDG